MNLSKPILLGQKFGNYTFLQLLGTGGFGAVYLARDPAVNREVAVKVILPEHANKLAFKDRFEMEARLVARLEHPHILPLYNFWQDDNGAFLVMRYVQGGSLRQIMRTQGALSLPQTYRIIRHIAEALTAAHDAGVIHRDVKPENILVDLRGNAYLTDFGIAKQVDNPYSMTTTGGIVGTMAYLSPERLEGLSATPQSDIYALGIILYELLAGEHPFSRSSAGSMIMDHLQKAVPQLNQKRPELPIEIDSIIARSTAKKPDDRFSTAQDFAELLTRAGESTAEAPRKAVAPTQIDVTEATHRVQRRTPTTPEGRNRYAMLMNVRKFWVEGVLENSIHSETLIQLEMASSSGKVETPWGMKLKANHGEEHTLSSDMRTGEIFEKLNGKMLILGEPGSGKTSTLLSLAKGLLAYAEMDEEYPIPVVFNLSSWSEQRADLAAWLVDELNGKYHVPVKVAAKWVEQDGLILLLDGLDEVAAEHRDACVEAINNYRAAHGFVDIVVCSRIGDYEALTNKLQLNGAFIIQPVDDIRLEEYLSRLGHEAASVRELLARDDQLRELARSPLMLSIIVLAFKGTSVDEIPHFDDTEARRNHLFAVYIDRMLERRAQEAHYPNERTLHYLAWLARGMSKQARTIFNMEDLQPDWLSTSGYDAYRRLLRYVLMAMFGVGAIGYLPYLAYRKDSLVAGAVGALLYAVASMILGWFISSMHVQKQRMFILVAGGYGLAIGFGAGISASFSLDITTVVNTFGVNFMIGLLVTYLAAYRNLNPSKIERSEMVSFSWEDVNPWIMAAFFVPGFLQGYPKSTLSALVSGLILAAAGGFISGIVSSELSTRFQPNQGIISSHRNGIRIAPILGVLLGLVMAAPRIISGQDMTRGVLSGIGVFCQITVVAYVFIGGYAAIQHNLIRRVLQRAGSIPANYVHFLNYAAALIILRKVGGGFIFIHRYLLEFFASSPANENP